MMPPPECIRNTGHSAPSAANEATQDAEAELLKINEAISISQDRADFLRQEIANMQGDRDQQNAALIAAAQRVKLAEIEVSDAEERLTGLLKDESDIRARLDGADMDVAALLSALQRIGKNPPPAMIIDPADAINAARSFLSASETDTMPSSVRIARSPPARNHPVFDKGLPIR